MNIYPIQKIKIILILIVIIFLINTCYSLDFYKIELYSHFCLDCGKTDLECEEIYPQYKNMEADNFEFPVGSNEAGLGYYIAQGFGEPNPRFKNKLHLGEDWNYQAGGDSDYYAPAYSIGKGIVTQKQSFGGGWGLVLRICHRLTEDLQKEFGFEYLESIYAHLAEIHVNLGDPVGKGQWISSIGNSGGEYSSHLHFELRSKPGLELGGGYADRIPDYYLHPIKFLSQFQKRFAVK